jgi:Cu-processing system permease protein
MGATIKIVRYQVQNVLRGRVLVAYGGFFLLTTLALLQLGGGVERTLPSLANLTLLTVPLVSLVVATVFVYDSREFIELLLSQPLGRRELLLGLFLGLALPLGGLFLLGAGIPLVVMGGLTVAPSATVLVLLAGALLTAVFTALGISVAVTFSDSARGLAAALTLWLALTVVYDGAILLASHTLAAYPLERPMLVAMLLNPVDLARILVLLAVDASALLGYTGAVFQDFFGSVWGLGAAILSLVAWVVLPYRLALRRFRRMDL